MPNGEPMQQAFPDADPGSKGAIIAPTGVRRIPALPVASKKQPSSNAEFRAIEETAADAKKPTAD